MKLTNMMMSPAEMKEKMGECCAMPDGEAKPEYPYGLRLSLCMDDLEKLGITKLPAVGAEMMLAAQVKVVATRQDATEEMDHKGMELQITDMALQGPKKGAADVMYDKEA